MLLHDQLTRFAADNGFNTIGALNVALIMTRRARTDGLPLDPEQQLAASGGQVRGLNGTAGNAILADHGVRHRMGTESGRTNRGSPAQMRAYVGFLNGLAGGGALDLELVEAFWVARIVARFEHRPFRIRRQPGASLQFIIADLLDQALQRQKHSAGAMVLGTVMQHLVGAKLEAALGDRLPITHHGATTSDQKGRGGDFDLGDSAIHVTASPNDALLRKCAANLAAGLRPIIVTSEKGVTAAALLAEQNGLADKVDIHAIGQFVATNAVELGRFDGTEILASLRDIIDRYNQIILMVEANPSLCIDWA